MNQFLGYFGLKQESEALVAKSHAAAGEAGSQAWYLAQSNRGEQLLAAGQVAEAAKVFQAGARPAGRGAQLRAGRDPGPLGPVLPRGRTPGSGRRAREAGHRGAGEAGADGRREASNAAFA